MSPQTVAEWTAELDGIALLKGLMPKAWANTVYSFEVGARAGLGMWAAQVAVTADAALNDMTLTAAKEWAAVIGGADTEHGEGASS